MSELRQLLGLITNGLDTLEKTCAANGTKIPSLTEAFHPASEAFRQDPAAAEATMIISAAALQLAATLLPPHIPLYHAIGGHWVSAALRTCLEASVTEVLREAGPEGLHMDEIGKKTGLDGEKIARCLRTLTVFHLYREVKPDVFANTRISSVLDTMKPSQEIIADPENKHDNTIGFAALAGHHLDEVFKASAYLWESLSDPKTAKSTTEDAAPISIALTHDKAYFDFLSQPDQAQRQKRFNIGMRAGHAMLSTNTILQAHDWKSLSKDAVIVDVGGGVGTVSMALAREHEHLKFVIQDRPGVVEDGIQVWKNEMPLALESGRVKFEAHDFFTAQPHTTASVFLVKHIVHDWSDENSIRILKRLRDVATPNTKLLLLENIIPYGCRVTDTTGLPPGALPTEAPEPLLAHWGINNWMNFVVDMTMMDVFNSLDRTFSQFDKLLKEAGWKIVIIRRPPGGHALAAIEAVPI